mmetsp:Transcript_22422/g.48545  ORF Transcript_22422/g.48545 Transcript_22422/m.48545 type:complete len:215 (+) Transcript_22422:774-1418(+)
MATPSTLRSIIMPAAVQGRSSSSSSRNSCSTRPAAAPSSSVRPGWRSRSWCFSISSSIIGSSSSSKLSSSSNGGSCSFNSTSSNTNSSINSRRWDMVRPVGSNNSNNNSVNVITAITVIVIAVTGLLPQLRLHPPPHRRSCNRPCLIPSTFSPTHPLSSSDNDGIITAVPSHPHRVPYRHPNLPSPSGEQLPHPYRKLLTTTTYCAASPWPLNT